jgi:hypothetical protein
MAEDFIDYEEKNTFEVPEGLFEDVTTGRNARDDYEASDEFTTDIQTEAFREEYAPVATKETAKIANDDDSGIYGGMKNFFKHGGIGVAKGVEEAGQTVGALEDNAWHLPKPETTAQGVAQVLGQALPLFVLTTAAIGVAGAGAVAAGVAGAARLAQILDKSRKLKLAKDFLVGSTAGAVSDAVAFDPKDPNPANFLLTIGAVAENPQAGAALKALAQNNEDDETKARLKAAAAGLVAGSLITGVLKGAGVVISKVRGTKSIDGVPVKDIEEAAKVEADHFVESVGKFKEQASPEQMKMFEDSLPDVKAAAKKSYQDVKDDYISPWDKLTPEKRLEAEDIVQKWSRGEKVENIDLSKIESMNLLKYKGPVARKQLIQFLSEKMEIKQLLKPKIKTQDFDTVEGMAEVLDIPMREASRIVKDKALEVREAIKFVGVSRALASAEIKKAEDGFALYAKTGNRADYETALSHTESSYNFMADGGELSKASSDLLRAHAKLIDPIDSITELKTLARHSIIYGDPELSIKQSGWFATRRNVDELKIQSTFKGGITRKSKLKKIKGESVEELRERALAQAKQIEFDEINKANLGQVKARLKAMNMSFKAKTRDALLEIYVNGLLSSVKTFEVNVLGNTTAMFSSVIDRAYAGVVKQGGEVSGKEAAHLAWGYMSGIQDIGKLWRQARKLEATENIRQDFIRPHDPAISKEMWRTGGMAGKAIDLMGSVVNLPGRLLLSADEVFKAINFRAETRALSYRKALREVGDSTTATNRAKINTRFGEILSDVESHPDIVEGATGFSAKNTYTNKLASYVIDDPITGKPKVVQGMGLKLKGLLDSDPTGIARVFLPFFQTPANLLNFAWERTPGLRKWNKTLQEELSETAPKAVRELAEAKVATANVLWVSTMGLAMTGNFTGGPPRNDNLRKTLEADMGGAHWFSYRFNGKWHKYDRFDPIGVIMAASAHAVVMGKAAMNLRGQYKQGDPSDEIFEKYKEVLDAGVTGMTRLITDRHYLQGFSDMLDVVSSDGDFASKGRKIAEKAASAANPFHSFYSSLRRNVTSGLEPEKLSRLQRTDLKDFEDFAKEIGDIFEDGMRKVTPGYGDKRAMKNLAGETVLFPGVNHEIDREPYQIISNVASQLFNPSPGLQPSKSPLIRKLAELESTLEQPSSINKVNGVTLADEEKAFYVDNWTDRNKKLELLVKSKNFNKFPQGTQRMLLEQLIEKHKRDAKAATLIKFPKLMRRVGETKLHDLRSKVIKDVPTGFNQFNLGQQ